jgi:hypothetical protein
MRIKFRRFRWLGFLGILFSPALTFSSHVTITLHNCDKHAITKHENLTQMFGNCFTNKNYDPFLFEYENKACIFVSFKDGYATMMIYDEDKKLKIEVITFDFFDAFTLIEGFEKYLSPCFFTIKEPMATN